MRWFRISTGPSSRASFEPVAPAAAALAMGLAWWWLWRMRAGGAAGPAATPPLMALAMWLAMVAAMMTPVALPWLRAWNLVAAANGGTRAVFLAGYAAVWLGFSVVGAALQLAAQRWGGPLLHAHAAAIAGAALLAAGLVQFTPWKRSCLAHCRHPLSYLLTRWRTGNAAAFGLGLRHGGFCVGCCWALMLTGLALGVMNLAWMAALTVMVTVEQWAPGGPRLAQLIGIGLVAAGCGVWWLG